MADSLFVNYYNEQFLKGEKQALYGIILAIHYFIPVEQAAARRSPFDVNKAVHNLIMVLDEAQRGDIVAFLYKLRFKMRKQGKVLQRALISLQ